MERLLLLTACLAVCQAKTLYFKSWDGDSDSHRDEPLRVVAEQWSVMCPDHESECPNNFTCCQLPGGDWGCCPLPDAVCCSDHLHCCPQQDVCNLGRGTCDGPNGRSALRRKTVARIARRQRAGAVICPDGRSECPTDTTCCILNTGFYGCCPAPNANCCSDKIHCCPSGETCDLSARACVKESGETGPLLKKTAAVSKVENVICPDQTSQCANGQTCCKLASGQWGCCPEPKAVCCSDGVHCCPHGTTCDVAAGKCLQSDGLSTPLLKKTPAISRVENVVCPDGASECMDGQTCCKLASGQYGCCPEPKAVCCSDGVHCCPHGTTCDVAEGKCLQSDGLSTPLLKKTPAISRVENVVCPDGTSQCANGQTCCKLASGQYGCCPEPKAVCCSDGVHCCPHGTTCDVAEGKCLQSDGLFTPLLKKTPAISKVENVVCPDGASECMDGQTCCKLASGQYGCCPEPRAVCCSDGVHCCPHGTTCDVAEGKCLQSDGLSTPLLKKTPAISRTDSRSNTICPDQSTQCSDLQTCCQLASGDWGCCPAPQAVCCSDGVHCCPHGTTCDVAAGKCLSPNGLSTPLLKKTAAVSKVENVICPDQTSQCMDGQTCCKLASGQWGCCPEPKAVCCSDGVHCCPHGTTCDVAAGKCLQSDGLSTPLLKKTPAISKVENVVCPDGTSQCANGQTCCKLASGQYGCCPEPKAVCCSDGVHCCPHGTTCDVAEGKCLQSDGLSTPLLKKTPAISKVENVVCPDGASECMDGQTCCKLASGQWGCCPEPRAVCCSDGVHCCPHGTTCDVAEGKCLQSDGLFTPLLKKTPAISRVENVVCPDGTSQCANGQTCCKLASGQYGCCPEPKAVCCSDGVHCCPHGTTCDVAEGKCLQSDGLFTPLLKKTPAISKVENVVCPDGASECMDGQTCCKLASGQYGCCPEPRAVCCSDGVHCCPHGTTCDVAEGKCLQSDGLSTPLLKKTPAISRTDSRSNTICPDQSTQCSDLQTCCQLASGDWGCCPAPQAVCCSDGVHCCPHGTTCDVAAGKCLSPNGLSTPLLKKTAAVSKVENVICPDQTSQCMDGQTCCKLASGQWGCCPEPKAVCCSDGVHCCPHGTTCDVAAGKCLQSDGLSTPLLKKTPAISKVENVVCPDGTSQCANGQTCCKLASGQYGCCPEPKAVCCSDGVHCCPHGTTCDVAEGKCLQSDGLSTPLLKKTPAISKVENVVCPDGASECMDGQTCCKLASGQWGCCPEPRAVCCSDGVHCCPHGTTCDVAEGKCLQSDGLFTPLLKKTPAISRVENVVCPDGTSQCANGQTCCKLASGQYGCCPEPKAVCCSDGVHCCPHGTTCDVAEGKCLQSDGLSTPLLKKTPAISKVENVVCPDGASECMDGQTCCKLASGQWGCCPEPRAVCCSDGVHCCPHGTTCDVAEGKCLQSDGLSTPLLKKTPAISRTDSRSNTICPDQSTQCSDLQTCCQLASGDWGCCPAPQAVCCSDGVHCCPHGTTCDVAAGKCLSPNGLSTPLLKKTAAVSKVENVICPDQTSQCMDGQTCCKLASGQWGCYPEPRAVCCSDGVHCCPHGTTCDVAAGKCLQSNGLSTPLLKKTPAISKVDNVVCPDGTSQCATGQTCCKLASGQYGCCPEPKAVCCSDGVHCCPHGTTCDVAEGKCLQSDGLSTPLLKKTAAVSKVENVICPDQTSQCANGQTCCKLASGQWGCCPEPKAVCCSDGVHCCPHGTTCDVAAGKCLQSDGLSVPMRRKVQSQKKVLSVTCPDGGMCPEDNSCCLQDSGLYACCPLKKAVCCSDKISCCPEGTTCDTTVGQCLHSSGIVFPMFRKVPAVHKGGNIVCPDGSSECPEGNTCCLLSTGQYGCCPEPKAVCCSDGVHCCPQGTKCDVAAGTCVQSNGLSTPLLKKTPAISKVENVVCPDGTSQCANGQTCCKLASGQYGCCPEPKAVCCSDGVHCCPHGTTCDVAEGKCLQSDGLSTPLLKKTPAISKVENVVCPDGASECMDGQTCCKLASGQYGCCPEPKAVCCSDGVHCCPHGTTCDVAEGKCLQSDGLSTPLLKKTPAISKVENVVCPDGASECSDGQTCCKLASGQYGCCPAPNAVCCSDGVHCCPHGTTCDVSAGRCISPDGLSMPFLKKTASRSQTSDEMLVPVPVTQTVTCPDGKAECPAGNTCCLQATGQYGCCPTPNAVCCQDGVHCCPEGQTCDTKSGVCKSSQGKVFPLLSKQPPLSSVICPDQQSECPDDNTCCLMAQGVYGCCPRPNAVCCSDHLHCCPHGTTCDVAAGKCTQGNGTAVPLLKKTAPIRRLVSLLSHDEEIASPVGDVQCPDHESSCPTGTTCCPLPSGQFGCCPLVSAVCCNDGIHCCPQGTTCDVAGGRCNSPDGSKMPAFSKLPSFLKFP